jgi:LacI family transcriptional regulator
MYNRNVTIHDIAARLNISASTVSRALNDYYRISKETRELVKKTAIDMNYKPNQLASNLRKGKGNMIGVIIPHLDRHFFSHAIAGMESITSSTDYNILICQTNEDFECEKRSIRALTMNRVDGIIISLAAGTNQYDHIQLAINEGIPVVMFDRIAPFPNVDTVINDNFHGAYEMTNHLIDQGFSNIIHFSGPQHLNVYRERLMGYKKAMGDKGLEVTDEMVFNDVLTRVNGEEAAKKILMSGSLPDAIFSSSDFSALGALLFFKNNGISIPQQIAVAGFANEPFTELTEPALTSMEQYGNEMGKSAARLLIERIEQGGYNEASQTITFLPKLMIRQSTIKNEFKTNDTINL